MTQRAAPDEIPRALHRTWWLPLVFVAVTIIALIAIPVTVSMRVQGLRSALSDGTDAARVILNDLEVAVATRELALQAHDRTAVDSAVKRQHGDELALDSVLVRLGPDAVEQFAQIRTVEHDWQAGSHHPGERESTPTQVIDTIEVFDQALQQRATVQREQIRELEHANVVAAVILASLALLATGLLFWVGDRILVLARDATAGRAALSAALDDKSALLRGVTHDLKNPLGAVYGYGELLADGVLGDLSAEQRDVVVRMQSLVTGALRTVSDLLDLYRNEGGALTIERVHTNLNDIVEACVADFVAAAQQAHLDLTFQRGERDATITTDPARVREILSNLLSNAMKYTPSGGSVTVAVSAPQIGASTVYHVDVCDTGPGVPIDQRERIFDEYYRLPGTESVPGNGVGLAIARRVARMLGGDITVSDASTGGARFTLALPANDG